MIWQAITSGTSIQYGAVDPSGHFTDSNGTPPPLMEGTGYTWLVFNNYGNDPLLTSFTAVGISFFSVVNPVWMAPPDQVAPADSAALASASVAFEWSHVSEAAGYHLYIYRMQEFAGRDIGHPFWDGSSLPNELLVHLATIASSGDEFRWRVIALNDQGNGVASLLRSFGYESSSGTAIVETQTAEGGVLPWVQINIEHLEGGVPLMPSFTDEDGECQRVLPAGTYLLTTRKDDYVEDEAEVAIAPGQSTAVTFQLIRAPGSIRGIVEDDAGRPVFDAEVMGTSEHGAVNTFTSVSGHFSLDVIAGEWIVHARKDGYLTSEIESVVVGGYGEVDLDNPLVLIGTPSTVTGSVLNPSGNPIAGATVHVETANTSYAATTNSTGRFVLTLPGGTWMLWAEKSGFETSETREVAVPNGGSVEVEPPFVLWPVVASITGRVTDGEVGFADALVVAAPPSGSVITTRTDANGDFLLTPQAPHYAIRAEVEGYRPSAWLQVTTADDESFAGLELIVEPRDGVIAGTVLGEGEPVAGALVTDGHATTLSDGDGSYALTVAEGLHELVAEKDGYFADAPRIVATAPGQLIEGLVLTIAPGAGSISGAVLHDGAPVPHAWVLATSGNQQSTDRADEEGVYHLLTEPGEWTLTPIRDGFECEHPAIVIVAAGQSASGVDLELTAAWATIEGTVTNGRGPVGQAEILIFREGEQEPAYETTSSTTGAYQVLVDAGKDYALEARAVDHGCMSVPVDPLGVGGFHVEHVALEEYTGSIAGTVSGSDGNEVDDALVVASWGDSVWIRTGKTGRSGWYELHRAFGLVRQRTRGTGDRRVRGHQVDTQDGLVDGRTRAERDHAHRRDPRRVHRRHRGQRVAAGRTGRPGRLGPCQAR